MGSWPVSGLRAMPLIVSAVPTYTTNNTKGSWVEISSALPFDVAAIAFEAGMGDSSGTPPSVLFDIGVGGAGSETVVISNFFRPCPFVGVDQLPGNLAHIPVTIPKGVRLAARAQNANASIGLSYMKWFLYPKRFTSDEPGKIVTTYGDVTGSSTGTTITAGSGYVQLVASTAKPIRYLISVWGPSGSGSAGLERYLAIGGSGAEVDIWGHSTVTRGGYTSCRIIPQPIFIPPGTRISAKAVTTSSVVTLYGVT